MKPICVPCRRFFRIETTGVSFVEGMPSGDTPAGDVAWQPYKLWAGDLWKCPGCGTETIVGTGRDAIAEHYQRDFNERVEKHGAKLLITD